MTMTSTFRSRVTGGEPNWMSDPKRGFETPGEMFAVMVRASRTGTVDPRLASLASPLRVGPMAAQGTDEQQGASNAAGGYFMPTGLFDGVLRTAPAQDPMGGVTEVVMDTPHLRLPARTDRNHTTTITGGITLARQAETTDVTPSRGQVEQVELTAYELMGVTFGTNSVVSDSPRAFGTWLEMVYRDALADVLRNERIRGSGVGEGLGILNSGALLTIDAEDGQAADTVVAANTAKMAARCWSFDEPGTTWTANPMLRQQLERLTDPDTGKPLYEFPREDGQRPRLRGVPVFYDERAAAPGDVGDLTLAHWPAYLSGTYVPGTFVSSVHVRYLANETAFRFYQRGDGAPWFRSAVTPRYGTDTLSPYVALGAR